MKEKLTQLESLGYSVVSALTQSAIKGFGSFNGGSYLANKYLTKYGNPEEAIEALIKGETVKGASCGFVTGLPGLAMLPITVPVEVSMDCFLGARLAAAVAELRGWDTSNEKVQVFITLCLAGGAGRRILRDAGIKLGMRVSEKVLGQMSKALIGQVNKKVGVRLATRVTQKGTKSMLRLVPLVGGAVGAAIDGPFIYGVGQAAKKTFPVKPVESEDFTEDELQGSLGQTS